MRTLLLNTVFLPLLLGPLVTGCSKGYRVRVSNFYYEKIDSVIVGNRALIFTDLDTGATSAYQHIVSGEHSVQFVVSDGRRFFGLAPLRKGGSGDRTIQIDGLRQVVVLED